MREHTRLTRRNKPPRRHNDRLLAMIRSQGRSFRWFSEQMGVSRYTLWRVEQGTICPRVDWYERGAAVLGVRVEDIAPVDELISA